MLVGPVLLCLLACAPDFRSRPWPEAGVEDVDSGNVDSSGADSGPTDTQQPPPCGTGGTPVAGACMDLYEAPNRIGAPPLVMYTFDEAEAWCDARGKRLCFDDEWEAACEGPGATAYPYGPEQVPGVCNDEETWIVYSQDKLNGWPSRASTPEVSTLEDLWASARAEGANDTVVEHLQELYQGEGGGDNAGCVGPLGVYDLTGNVEEWTRRRDGGQTSFHGNLKGRYWAETRTCQSDLTSHGDGFRFYEIGFRCCWDLE